MSKKLISLFPGLVFYFIVEKYDENTNTMYDVIKKMYERLALKKQKVNSNIQNMDFGINVLGNRLGKPAITKVGNEYISGETLSKEYYNKHYFNKYFCDKDLIEPGYGYTNDFDKSENGFKAIVHIDGNNLGEKMANYNPNTKNSNEFLKNMKNVGNNIDA